MTKPISVILGIFIYYVYNILTKIIPNEPTNISYYAISIIVTTLILKIIVLPLTISQMKNQKKMAKLQPEIAKLQKKYKNDPQALAIKQRQFYKDANYNVLSGCLPMIVQLLILIGFYGCFYKPQVFIFKEESFYETMNKNFYYIQNLGLPDKTMILPILAAITTFITSYLATKSPAAGSGQDQAKSMMNSMMIVMPIMIFFMGRTLQAELIIYWTVSNIFAIVQQLIVNKVVKNSVEESNELRN